MRALALLTVAVVAALPSSSSAQGDVPSYYDQVIAADDRTTCDETGWSLIASDMTSTMSEAFAIALAACGNMVASCAPDAWRLCTISSNP
jgi:hypothetical protein